MGLYWDKNDDADSWLKIMINLMNMQVSKS